MRRLLEQKRTVLIIPGGVAECLEMKPGVETIYLRKRFGFVKIAIQTGAQLVPAQLQLGDLAATLLVSLVCGDEHGGPAGF